MLKPYARPRHSQRGMTLIELIAAIMLMGVLIAGPLASLLNILQSTTRSSANAQRQAEALALAHGAMEQELALPFASLPACGAAATALALTDAAGATIPAYSAEVTSRCDNWPAVAAGSAVRVSVTVKALAADDNSELSRVTLDGYRATYPAGKVTRTN